MTLRLVDASDVRENSVCTYSDHAHGLDHDPDSYVRCADDSDFYAARCRADDSNSYARCPGDFLGISKTNPSSSAEESETAAGPARKPTGGGSLTPGVFEGMMYSQR